MAFPVVESSATNKSGQTSVTSHTMIYPTGIEAGDLLVGLVGVRNGTPSQNPTVTYTESGWTKVGQITQDDFGVRTTLALGYAVAAGTESGDCGYSTDILCWSACRMLRISGADTSTNLPDWTTFITDGYSTSHDAPSHTAAVTDDILWIWADVWNVGPSDETVTAYPANYGSNQAQLRSGTAGQQGAAIASATRNLNASSEDPAAATLSNGVLGSLGTIAVYPAQQQATPTGRSIDIDLANNLVTVTQGR